MTRTQILDVIVADLRYALRSFSHAKGFVSAAVISVALGIGVSTAMFGVLRAVLIRPLPIRDQSRVILLWGEVRSQPGAHVPLKNGYVWSLRQSNRAFDGVGSVVLAGATAFMARYDNRAFPLALAAVDGDFFRVLGLVPQQGRMLTLSDDEPGAPNVVVISDKLWRQQFGADPKVVGQSIELRGAMHTIIGVAPSGFEYPAGSDAWTSEPRMERQFSTTLNEEGGWFDIVARVKPGVSIDRARSEAEALLRQLPSRTLPTANDRIVRVSPIEDVIVGDERPSIIILACAVALLLVMTCANLGSLFLTRGLARVGEFSVRASIGATRQRLIGQLVVESTILAIAGGVLGIGFGWSVLRFVVALAPPGLARFDEIRLDAAAVLFALLLTGVCILAFAFFPAMQSAGTKLEISLRKTSKAVTDVGWRRFGARPLLVVAQFAIAVIVLAGSVLLLRTLSSLQRMDLGFESEHLLFAVIQNTQPGTDEIAANQRFQSVVDGLLDQLPKQKGVADVASAAAVPFNAVSGAPVTQQHFAIEGQDPKEGLKSPPVIGFEVGVNYFKTMGIPIVRGRPFTDGDASSGVRVCIVSEAVAADAWPGQDPIGKQLRVVSEDDAGRLRTVVGVTRDVRFLTLRRISPAIYAPLDQRFPSAVLAIHTVGSPRLALGAVKATLSSVDQAWAVREAVTMPELLSTQLAQPRLLSAVLGTLSMGAVLLAALGAFSILTIMVAGRRNEFGVRLALGATSNDIRRLVLREGMWLTSVGVAVGLGIAVSITRLLRSQLYGIGPTDPATLIGVIGFLFAVALTAYYLPATRAANSDPVQALRRD